MLKKETTYHTLKSVIIINWFEQYKLSGIVITRLIEDFAYYVRMLNIFHKI